MATIIDGKRLAAEVRERASANVADLAKRGVPCGLAVVLVGDDQGSATYVRAKLRDCEECGIPSRDYKLPASLAKRGVPCGLAVVLVGDDQGSATYVRAKLRDCEECGIPSRDYKLPASTTQADLMELVASLNADPDIAGILVQMPLPGHLDAEAVVTAIDPLKDVDGFHPENLGRLVRGLPGLRPCTPAGIMEMLDAYGIDPSGKNAVIVGRSSIVGKPMSLMLLARNATISCTPAGIMEMLDAYGIDPSGKNAVIVGRSSIVGKPMSLMLLARNATISVAHSHTDPRELARICQSADILVAACGIPKMIKGPWVKPGAAVIDVGMDRDEHGALCGDVDFDSAELVAGAITPVPGGVGPMTRAMLMSNIDVGMDRDEHGALCGDVDFDSAELVAGAITPVPGGVGPMTRAMLMSNVVLAAKLQHGLA